MATTRRVVITRPRQQAHLLAQRLVADGCALVPLCYPAIAIAAPLDPAPLRATLAALASYRLVIFVSPNAIDHALAELNTPWPSATEIGVMGPGSLAALARHGLTAPAVIVHAPLAAVDNARFDSEALFARLDVARLVGESVLIVKGNGGRPWLAERLAAAGVQVSTVEAYRRFLPEPDAATDRDIGALIDGGEAAAVVVTSSEGLTHLMALLHRLRGPAGGQWLALCTLYVPHRRIAENATAAGLTRLVLTGPGDESISRALK